MNEPVPHDELPALPGYLEPLNALARQRLADGGFVDLYVECYVNSEYGTGPAWAVLRLDMRFLDLVETASSEVIRREADGWSSIALQRGPVSWDEEGSDVGVKYWSMSVSADAVSLVGQPKYGTETVESRVVPLKDLVQALNADEMATLRVLTDESMPINFAWHGGVLVYGVSDVAELAVMVEESSDEISAKHAANVMRHEIEMAAAAAPQPTDAEKRPRKPRIRV